MYFVPDSLVTSVVGMYPPPLHWMILENEYTAAILLVNLSTLGWVFHEPQNKTL